VVPPGRGTACGRNTPSVALDEDARVRIVSVLIRSLYSGPAERNHQGVIRGKKRVGSVPSGLELKKCRNWALH